MKPLTSILWLVAAVLSVRWNHWHGANSESELWLKVLVFASQLPHLNDETLCMLSVEPYTQGGVLQLKKEMIIAPFILETRSFREGAPNRILIQGWDYFGRNVRREISGEASECIYDSLKSFSHGIHLSTRPELDRASEISTWNF